MKGTVKIDIEEYNRLRDRDLMLSDMEQRKVIITMHNWNVKVTTIAKNIGEAFEVLNKRLSDTEFELFRAKEQLDKVLVKQLNRKWWHIK